MNAPLSAATEYHIIGAGLAGLYAGVCLVQKGYTVHIWEQQTQAQWRETGDRCLLINRGSALHLQQWGVWDPIEHIHPHPILRVHVSRAGSWGRTVFEARSWHLPYWAVHVPVNILQDAACSLLDAHGVSVHWQTPAPASIPSGARRIWATGLPGIADSEAETVSVWWWHVPVAALAAPVYCPHTAFQRMGTHKVWGWVPFGLDEALCVGTCWNARGSDPQQAWEAARADWQGLVPLPLVPPQEGRCVRVPLPSKPSSTCPEAARVGQAAYPVLPLAAQGFNLAIRRIAQEYGGHSPNPHTPQADSHRDWRRTQTLQAALRWGTLPSLAPGVGWALAGLDACSVAKTAVMEQASGLVDWA